ncbi:hypothetical protein V8E53_007612 [Lactarius tabidus]
MDDIKPHEAAILAEAPISSVNTRGAVNRRVGPSVPISLPLLTDSGSPPVSVFSPPLTIPREGADSLDIRFHRTTVIVSPTRHSYSGEATLYYPRQLQDRHYRRPVYSWHSFRIDSLPPSPRVSKYRRSLAQEMAQEIRDSGAPSSGASLRAECGDVGTYFEWLTSHCHSTSCHVTEIPQLLTSSHGNADHCCFERGKGSGSHAQEVRP